MRDWTKVSKLLSYVLRHNPSELDLELDPQGWTDAQLLLDRLAERRGLRLGPQDLAELVAADAKGRYSLREGRIRANQGHSVEVLAADPTPREPPESLYHGTTEARWERIRESGGLRRMRRHHVHLSGDEATARQVAGRHRGERPLLLRVEALRMHREGHVFLLSDNGVWLAEEVPLEYLNPLDPGAGASGQGGGSA